ncbi:hypothetical protein CONPUDRAFT_136143 [Coniophora puteana RWD-64-598 SS2]|uniref:Uncharacterized protein n=1 Tax=Coniophora puteana (strain RWD-64-598) TaxID=741705 RepID=A0A5M3MUW5_CONPW|nr:uncharacterized protein CONPUDRAFT_136143 [Coniophora puteana RWD-64-598 SS2]EIW82929.1 hypothetical protein CONPUDRAFT_136143 [Coniophora puteana RWD-64-598 SS2]
MEVKVNPVYTRSRLARWRDALVFPTSVCCCIPVRIGFLIMTFLTILFAFGLSIVIWFEVFKSSNPLDGPTERKAFICAGILESSLALAAVAGFVGAVTRQYKSVLIYTYFIYVHFFLNIIIGIWFLVAIRQSNRDMFTQECDHFVDENNDETCSKLAAMSEGVFVAVTACVLLLELYGVLIASGYRRHLHEQKENLRQQRLGYYHAMGTPAPLPKHSRSGSTQSENALLHPTMSRDSSYVYEDPYEENNIMDIRPLSTTDYQPVSTQIDPEDLNGRSIGYGHTPETSSSSSVSTRRMRSLPPLPSLNSNPRSNPSSDPLQSVRQTEWANEKARQLDGRPRPLPRRGESSYTRPPANPPPPLDVDVDYSRDEISTAVSTHVHSALLDHAAVMQGAFRPVFVPSPRDRARGRTLAGDEPPPYRQMSRRAP